jgi:uncharacterized cupin superfamily protein
MNRAYDAPTVPLVWAALDDDQCPDGPVSTGVGIVGNAAFASVGVWEHPAGISTDVEADEVFVVLSGSGRVILSDGSELALRPGTVGILEAGTATTWIIDEPLRKVWVARP